ncbi:hypothetical protein lerEdw1_020987 [Lerista edwardsae]|nr:hypothetical protein lerEdw1_020987 [Lerista edwardsae]
MWDSAAMRLWLWAALGLGALLAHGKDFDMAHYPTISNETFIKACLDAHNQFRTGASPRAAKMLYMVGAGRGGHRLRPLRGRVVWDTSYKLGCAIVFCRKFGKQKNIENFVCNYGPGGNYPRRPYITGKPCSRCEKGDTCENNLCRNADRDRDVSKRYSRWYPPFEFRIICDESCIAVAILRPLLMFLAFGVVLCLKSKNPSFSS